MTFINFYFKIRDRELQGHLWLNTKLEEEKTRSQSNMNSVSVPLKDDGTMYKIEEANEKQKHIVLLVLETLKNWVECTTNPSKASKAQDFKPLRMTVRGMAGSGKSFLLHLLSSTI